MEMREWVRHERKGQPSGRQKKSQGSEETRNRMTYKRWSEKVSNWIPISIYFDML